MDLFYKPPLQRADECRALEENYMNCMLQKALKDNVMNNKCKLDSVLWFHMECPLDAAKFDDPIEFKRKWRNFFAEMKATAEFLTVEHDEEKRMREEYAHVPYPEDVKEKVQVRPFNDEFKHLSPILHDELDMDEDDDFMTPNKNPSGRGRDFGKTIPGLERNLDKVKISSDKWGGDSF